MIEYTTAGGNTPLYIAALKDRFECVLILLDRGAHIDQANNGARLCFPFLLFLPMALTYLDGETPLFAALTIPKLRRCAMLLIQRGANIDSTTNRTSFFFFSLCL